MRCCHLRAVLGTTIILFTLPLQQFVQVFYMMNRSERRARREARSTVGVHCTRFKQQHRAAKPVQATRRAARSAPSSRSATPQHAAIEMLAMHTPEKRKPRAAGLRAVQKLSDLIRSGKGFDPKDPRVCDEQQSNKQADCTGAQPFAILSAHAGTGLLTDALLHAVQGSMNFRFVTVPKACRSITCHLS
jgi:hypothetical protein